MITKEQFIKKVKTQVFPELLENEKKCQVFRSKVIVNTIMQSFFALLSVMEDVFSLFSDIGNLLFKKDVCVKSDLFIQESKKKISPVLLKFLGNCHYLTHTKINIELLKQSCIFPDFSNVVYRDCLSGKFFDTTFSISVLTLHKGTGTLSVIPVFKGACIDIPLKKRLSGYTLLFHHHVPKNIPVLQCIDLEDNLFDMNYQIYTSDQIEARALLTPAFMERLNNLKKSFKNRHMDVAFFENHAFFVLPSLKNIFEPCSLFCGMRDLAKYERFYDEMQSVYELIKCLQINNSHCKTNKMKCFSPIYQDMKVSKDFRNFALWFIPLILIVCGAIIAYRFLGGDKDDFVLFMFLIFICLPLIGIPFFILFYIVYKFLLFLYRTLI